MFGAAKYADGDAEGKDEEWEDVPDDDEPCDLGCPADLCIRRDLATFDGDKKSTIEIIEALSHIEDTILGGFSDEAYPHMTELAEVIADAAESTAWDTDIRVRAIRLCQDLSEARPKDFRECAVVSERIIPALVACCEEVGFTDDWGATDTVADQDVEEEQVEVAASQTLDSMSLELGGAFMLPIVAPLARSLLLGDDIAGLIAGLTTVSHIAEGAALVLRPMLSDLTQMVVPCLVHPNARVRWSACNTIAQLASDFKAEMGGDARHPENFQAQFHDTVLPALFALIDGDEGNPRIQSHGLSALSTFVEYAHRSVLQPYLDDLLLRLGGLLASPHKIILEQVVTAIAATSRSCSYKFDRYYPAFYPPLLELLSTQPASDDRKILRAKAMECISLMWVASEKELCARDIAQTIEVLRTFQDDLSDYDFEKKYVVDFYVRVCHRLGADFAEYLSEVMPFLEAAVQIEAKLQVVPDEDAVEDLPGGLDGWETVDAGGSMIAYNKLPMSLKCVATVALQVIPKAVKASFKPYLVTFAAKLGSLLNPDAVEGSINHEMRVRAAEALPALLSCALDVADECEGPSEEWAFIAANLFRLLFDAMEPSDDDDVDVPDADFREACLQAYAACLSEERFELDEEMEQRTLLLMKSILAELCERCAERAEKREENSDVHELESLYKAAERDASLTMDWVTVADEWFKRDAKQLADFYRTHFHEPLADLAMPGETRLDVDRHQPLMVYCCVVEYMGEDAYEFWDDYKTTVQQGVKSDYLAMRRTALFLTGQLAKYGGAEFRDAVEEIVPDILEGIASAAWASREGQVRSATENAAASLLYIATSLPGCGGVTLKSVMPAVLPMLPFWEDLTEGNHVLKLLCTLVSEPDVLDIKSEALAAVLTVFAEAALGKDAEFADGQEEADKCVETVKTAPHTLLQNHPDEYSTALGLMDPSAREALIARCELPPLQ